MARKSRDVHNTRKLNSFAQIFEKKLLGVLSEVERTIRSIDPMQVNSLAHEILSARRIYTAGAGRSGLVSSCFAMRLVHLGLVAHVVGEATAPGVAEGDLLIVSSGSGRTRTVIAQASAARSRGTRVAAVTADERSPLARQADIVMLIPCPPFSSARGKTIQFGGSLFEQSLLLFYDTLILELAERLGRSPLDMRMRHANLE